MRWSPLFIRDKLLFYYALGLLNLAGERHMESKCSFSIERRDSCHVPKIATGRESADLHSGLRNIRMLFLGPAVSRSTGGDFRRASSLTSIDRSGVHCPSSVSYPLFTERRQTLSDVRYAARTISANLCRSGSSSCCQLALNVQSDLGHGHAHSNETESPIKISQLYFVASSKSSTLHTLTCRHFCLLRSSQTNKRLSDASHPRHLFISPFPFLLFFHLFFLSPGRLKICLMKKLLVIPNSLSGSINAIITISRDRWPYISKDNTSTAEMNELPKEEKRSHHPSNGEKRLELFSISQRNQQTRIRNQS